MSGLEIERKFLIKKGGSWKEAAFSSSHIKQGYMPCESATVRVRTRDDRSWLTIKSHSDRTGLSRYEFEKEITNDEAKHLFELCRGGVIDKRRWLVKSSPDFVIASPKNLPQRVWRFSDALPSTVSECIHPDGKASENS